MKEKGDRITIAEAPCVIAVLCGYLCLVSISVTATDSPEGGVYTQRDRAFAILSESLSVREEYYARRISRNDDIPRASSDSAFFGIRTVLLPRLCMQMAAVRSVQPEHILLLRHIPVRAGPCLEV